MTVSTEISSNEYTGNGVTTDFDYKFRIFKANQLSVITSDADGDNVVTLRLGTDYTVTGANKSAGGKVILTKPLAEGRKISIARDIPITQETSFRNQSKFFAETHEDAFDYLTMIVQRIWGSLGSLYLKRPNILANWFDAKGYRIANLGKPKRDSDAVDLGTLKDEISGVNSTILKREKRFLRVDDMDISALPKASERAGNVLTFDKDGKPIVVAPASGSAVDVLNRLNSTDGHQLIGGLKDNYSRRFPNVSCMKSALDITDGMLVSTQGFYQNGDNGEANYIISSNLTADGANVIALDNGLFAKLTGETVSALSLGFKDDETLDQSSLFDTTMKYRGGKVIFDGISVKVSSYSKLSRAFDFINGAKIIASPSSPINLFEIDVNDTEFGHISIDCGYKALLPIRITGSGNTIRKIKIENLHAPIDTGTGVIGVQIRGSNNTIGSIEGADCQNTGNSNLSMPQLVHVYDSSFGGHIDSITTHRCCSILNAANNNEISVGRMRLIDSQDNGIYGGGKITVGHFYYEGEEEPLAFTDNADVSINLAEIGGYGLGAISYTNMKQITINHLRLFKGKDGKTPLSIVNIRGNEGVSGTLHIGEISGEMEPVRFLSLDKGFTERLIIDKCNLDVFYDAQKMKGSFADIRNTGSFSFGEINIKMIDKNNATELNPTSFQFQFPLSPKSLSILNRFNFYGVRSDGSTLQQNITFRGENLRHPNVYVQSGCWQVNIGPYLREVTWNISWTQGNGININPTVGYWRKGEDFALINATSSGPFRARCIESGTPGVWKAY